MSAINDGGAAFPVPGLPNDESFNGMSLRDYGIHSTAAINATEGACMFIHQDWRTGLLAVDKYAMTNAMLKAREGIK